jgi:hypothetical protein
MSNFIKKFFNKEEDDIPSVKLQKNEPKSYYCKEYKVWMIEGKEEEILKEISEKNKPPPVKSIKKDNDNMPKTAVKGNQPKKNNVGNRYPPVLHTENIEPEKREPEVDNLEDRPKVVKPFVPARVEINLEEEVITEPIKTDCDVLKTENTHNEEVNSPEKVLTSTADFKANETVYVINNNPAFNCRNSTIN